MFPTITMLFILYCMTNYTQYYTDNLIHPVDQSTSRDLSSIELRDLFIFPLAKAK